MASAEIDKNLFFQHRECDYFPCHAGVPLDRFNCMLCYCPLYALGRACGGKYTYTENGVKDCSACIVPHNGDSGVRLVHARFGELSRLAAREDAACEAAAAEGGAEGI